VHSGVNESASARAWMAMWRIRNADPATGAQVRAKRTSDCNAFRRSAVGAHGIHILAALSSDGRQQGSCMRRRCGVSGEASKQAPVMSKGHMTLPGSRSVRRATALSPAYGLDCIHMAANPLVCGVVGGANRGNWAAAKFTQRKKKSGPQS